MEQKHVSTFHKSEHLCSKRLTDALFAGGNKSLVSFPVRAVFMPVSANEGKEAVQVLVSVSKRHFKRAVRRNRIKRQMREAYRRQKHILTDVLDKTPGKHLAVAFLWLADRQYASSEVDACIRHLLTRIAERFVVHSTEPSPHE